MTSAKTRCGNITKREDIESSKSEIRNPKETNKSECVIHDRLNRGFELRFSDFLRASVFGFRISLDALPAQAIPNTPLASAIPAAGRPYSLAVTRASATNWRQRNAGRVAANSSLTVR
jgi:hypothetical protein